MKIVLLIIFSSLFFTIFCQYNTIYKETPETIKQRLEFNQNYTKLITGGKVVFEHDDEKGTYCVARQQIDKKEFTFKIPKNFTICAFEMFPYKFELKEAMMEYFVTKYGATHNETYRKAPVYLMAFQLMFYSSKNKSEIIKSVKDLKKDFYAVNTTPEAESYLESLPKAIYTMQLYEEEDLLLMKKMGFSNDLTSEPKDVLKLTIKNLMSKYPKIYVRIF